MREKVIAIMNKPTDCTTCVFGVCKYSLPSTTRRKGYYCMLKEPKDRVVEDFDYDEKIHLSNCPLKPYRAKTTRNIEGRLRKRLKHRKKLVDNDCNHIDAPLPCFEITYHK